MRRRELTMERFLIVQAFIICMSCAPSLMGVQGLTQGPSFNLTSASFQAQPRAPAPPLFSVVTLQSHELSDGVMIDCVRLLPDASAASTSSLKFDEVVSQFPKAGSGWRKVTRAATDRFQEEVPMGCSAHPGSMAVQRGDIFDTVIHSQAPRRSVQNGTHINTPSDLQHDYAIYSSESQTVFSAVFSIISINNPTVQDGEVSLSQVWLITQPGDENSYSTLEAGWIVHPGAFGDNDPRLFIYWTNDNYVQTGCFNLLCPGFVQTDTSWTLGEKFPSGSSVPGDPNRQKSVLFVILWDVSDSRWWFSLNNRKIGYWDSNYIINFDNNFGDEIQIGGEVQCVQPSASTEMGSGYAAGIGFPWAAYHSAPQYMISGTALHPFKPDNLAEYVTQPDVYALGDLLVNSDGDVAGFYFGGPKTI